MSWWVHRFSWGSTLSDKSHLIRVALLQSSVWALIGLDASYLLYNPAIDFATPTAYVTTGQVPVLGNISDVFIYGMPICCDDDGYPFI